MLLSRMPLYLQVMKEIQKRIAEGVWTGREAIPSETELAQEFGVASGTVRKAIDELCQREVLIRRQGSGTYIRRWVDAGYWNRFQPFQQTNGQLVRWTSEFISLDKVAAPEDVASALAIEPGTTVLCLKRRMFWPQSPDPQEQLRGSDTVYLNAEVFSKLTRESFSEGVPGSLYAFYEEKAGIHIASVSDRLQVKIVNDALSHETFLPVGTPIFELYRIGRDWSGKAVEYRIERSGTWDLQVALNY